MTLMRKESDVCPYQGLAPFETDDTELFFGRTQATRDLLDRLGPRLKERGSILLVSGASGVGKSSLLRAGLMPALAKGMPAVPGSSCWTRLVMTPTATPLRTLAETWTAAYGGQVEAVHERLRDDPQALPAGRLVLVVDQFEELFTLVSDEQERQAFVRALHALAEAPQGAGVIIGLRADYWDRCAAYPQFAAAIQDGQVIVEPLTGADLRLAITGPAAAVGLEIESGLVEVVLGELKVDGDRYEPGVLPLLSQALRNTWDRREDGRLTIRGYEESGRVRDSVRRTADEVLGRLTAEDRKTALKVFRRMTLITAEGRMARRRAKVAEIYAAASAHEAAERDRVDALLSTFADRRLITLHEETVEIAHDALLTAWPTLRQWLEPDLTAQTVYERLIDDAGQWAGHHGDPAFLYRGARLLSVQESRSRWDRDPESFPPAGATVDGFVAASADAARRAGRRRSLVMAGLAALSVLALIAAGTALDAANDADHQRHLAVSRQLAAQSEVVGDPVTSALLAVAAWRIAPTSEARYRLLTIATGPDRGALTGHRAQLSALAFSPDGTIVATGGRDGTARLWDTASRRQLGAPIVPPRQECADAGVKVAFAPDGRMLASACLGTVRFWDVRTHRQLGAPLDAGGLVTAVAFARDGRTLATGSVAGALRLWDVAARRPRGDTLGHATGTAVNAVVFSSDGKHLATASDDRTARIWDTATYEQVGAAFSGHTDDVKDVSFSPDGTTLATASLDGTARLWNLTTHRQTGAALKAGGSGLSGIAFNPDGRTLATAGNDGLVRLWGTADHRQLGTALGDGSAGVVAEGFSPRAAFSPDGRLLAVSGDDGAVRLEDPVVHRQIGSAIPGSSAIALSPDGRTLATGSEDGAARLWDVATRRAGEHPLRPADGTDVLGLKFGPGGRALVMTSSAGVWTGDVASGRTAGLPFGQDGRVGAMALSPDGGLLAAQRDGAVLVLDVNGRRELGPRIRVPGHTDIVSALAFSPDRATLAIAGFDRRVRVFDVATRRQIGAPLPITVGGFVDALAFSPDGGTLAVSAADHTVRLWDLARRRPAGGALTGHTGAITSIAFSPDGRALATGAADDTVRLWDLLTYRQIGAPLTGHTRAVTGLAFSPDGTTVDSVSDDGTARIWNVAPPADPVATVCAGAGRSFTRAEWERYVPQEKFRRICR